jgi:microcystin-dependent protein
VSDPFLAEIRLFASNFAPDGWALCDGQILSIAQNTALFSLLGTTYGGNGTSNFALPNLQASVPIGAGQGAGLSSRILGEAGGSQNVTLTASELASHSHAAMASTNPANTGDPAGAFLAVPDPTNPIYLGSPGASLPFAAQSLGPPQTPAPHNNLQPYLVVNFIIALTGIFPTRS